MSGSGGGGISKLGTALVIIFAIALLALFSQLFYALWRRRVFRRQANTATGGGDEISLYSSSESTLSAAAPPSKELLYFLCVRPQFRLDSDSPTPNSGAGDLNSNHRPDFEVVDVDLLKIHGIFAPPRFSGFSFTVKGEEKDLESPARIDRDPGAEEESEKNVDGENGGGVEYYQSVDFDDATPFSTPCASPVYFTPSASPVNDAVSGRSTGETAA